MEFPIAYTVVIPSRMGATRLPGKPLLDIGGKPMVQRVWEQASESAAQRVVIATDDQRIVDAARSFGAEALMTSPEHPSGTDRLRRCVLIREGMILSYQLIESLAPPHRRHTPDRVALAAS